ncbi:hypothetical protein [Arthrobacter sp. B2a2-09]|uniref:hypothetical protein n=1 Tax=Arthrobacter sp. B2a2-09 TaxID=2952822 RepID=UPI0022CD68E0|nr:hypothetical protein [Arthrobacter sp. B2a2-09]MCZ9880596.1 hypothetical protein [Arthrobacter sp. B2a2-09]
MKIGLYESFIWQGKNEPEAVGWTLEASANPESNVAGARLVLKVTFFRQAVE